MRMSAMLLAEHETRDEDDDSPDAWQPGEGGALLTYVEDLDGGALTEWQRRAPHIQPPSSCTAGIAYLANVCNCGALQGDWFLTKPDGPFFPRTEPAARAIGVTWVEMSLDARAGTSESAWIHDLIAQVPYTGRSPPP